MLATVNWSGAGDGTTWTSAANWIGGAVPGSNDSAVIGAVGKTIDLAGTITVGSVVSAAPLDIISGSLTVHSGSSQANAGLTVASGSSVVANGAGTSLNASGTTVINGETIFAQNGGSISLPGVTNYSTSSNSPTLEATGTGSVLSLANLTSVSVGTTFEMQSAVPGSGRRFGQSVFARADQHRTGHSEKRWNRERLECLGVDQLRWTE